MTTTTDEPTWEDKVQAYRDEYDVYVRVWADVERKAQVVAATAGAFVGAGVALANSGIYRGPGFGPAFAILGVVLLATSSTRAIAALLIRSDVPVVSGAEVVRISQDGAQDPDLVNLWIQVTDQLRQLCARKAELVADAQLVLALAIWLFSALTIVKLLMTMFELH